MSWSDSSFQRPPVSHANTQNSRRSSRLRSGTASAAPSLLPAGAPQRRDHGDVTAPRFAELCGAVGDEVDQEYASYMAQGAYAIRDCGGSAHRTMDIVYPTARAKGLWPKRGSPRAKLKTVAAATQFRGGCGKGCASFRTALALAPLMCTLNGRRRRRPRRSWLLIVRVQNVCMQTCTCYPHLCMLLHEGLLFTLDSAEIIVGRYFFRTTANFAVVPSGKPLRLC